MKNWTAIIERYIAEGRTVSGGKGDSTASDTEKSQGDFTNTLQQAFANNNQNQQQQLSFLSNQLQSAVTNPQGYTPETLAAMRTQATESAATNNKNVEQALGDKFATESSPTSLPNGVQEQVQGQAESAIANNEANAQMGITEQNGQLQNENEWKAIQGEEQVAQEENPEAMASGDNSAASTVGGLSQAVTQSQGPSIGSILGGVVGAGLGASSGLISKI